MREDEEDHAENRCHEDVALPEERSKVPQVVIESDKAGERCEDRKASAEEGRRIRERQRAVGVAAAGHRISVIGGERIDRRARRVDQDGGNGAAVHARAVDAEQENKADEVVEKHGRGQECGDGDRRSDSGNCSDDEAAYGADGHGDEHLGLHKVPDAFQERFHQK